MEIEFTCLYCDHKFIKTYYSSSDVSLEKCPKCGDKNLKAKDVKKDKIDTYDGSPPFPEKPKKEPEKEQDNNESNEYQREYWYFN